MCYIIQGKWGFSSETTSQHTFILTVCSVLISLKKIFQPPTQISVGKKDLQEAY